MIELPAPAVHTRPNCWKILAYDAVDLLVFDHPDRNQDDPGYSFLLDFLREQPEPWRWHTLFNLLQAPGITPFYVIEEFSKEYYKLVGAKDRGRRVVTVDNNPVTASRYEHESFKNLFPTREFRLFDNLDAGLEWILRP